MFRRKPGNPLEVGVPTEELAGPPDYIARPEHATPENIKPPTRGDVMEALLTCLPAGVQETLRNTRLSEPGERGPTFRGGIELDLDELNRRLKEEIPDREQEVPEGQEVMMDKVVPGIFGLLEADWGTDQVKRKITQVTYEVDSKGGIHLAFHAGEEPHNIALEMSDITAEAAAEQYNTGGANKGRAPLFRHQIHFLGHLGGSRGERVTDNPGIFEHREWQLSQDQARTEHLIVEATRIVRELAQEARSKESR